MATAPAITETAPQAHDSTTMLISLCPQSPEGLQATLANLAAAFAGEDVLVATPDAAASTSGPLRILPYTPSASTTGSWILTAADYVNTYKLMQEHKASVGLLLGTEAQTLHPDTIRGLAAAVTAGADLVTPRYVMGPRDGLVNSAILYPTTRALFGTRPRYPLAIDMGFTLRMADRLAACAQKFTAASQNAAIVWPVAEAASAGFGMVEVQARTRALPPPDATDLNSLLAQVAGSLFADVDAKASFWQRARLAYSPKAAQAQVEAAPADSSPVAATPDAPDVQPMLDSFRLAYTNLHEIWSLVLPPNSLLGLKKLSLMPPASFRMPDALWTRIVYDFILAYRLRTINRGHLLGALTPLYLAWVASHLLLVQTMPSEKHIEALAAAFEADKPYLVSRWRWPDRFNP